MGVFARMGAAVRERVLQRYTEPAGQQRAIGGGRPVVAPLPSSPSRDEHTDLIVGAALEWDLRACRNAIGSHVSGTFASSALLWDAMLGDDRIASCMNTRVLGVQGLPFEMAPAIDDSSEAQEVADAASEDWQYILPPSTLTELLEWETGMGFALAEIIWDTSGKRWIPRLKLWHPQFVYYRLDLRQYVAIAQEGPIYITPGDGKWLLFSRHAQYRAWMRAALRPLLLPWLARQYSYRDWARFNEVHGNPIRQARVPAEAPDADKRSWWQQIRNVGAIGALLAPENKEGRRFALELVEAAHSENAELFEKAMMRGDANIALHLLGQNLSGGEIKGGSLAAAKEAGTVRDDYKLADVTALMTDLGQQVMRPYAAFNFGDADLAAKPSWDAQPPEDQAKSATTFETVAKGAAVFVSMGAKVNVEKMVETYDLPIDPTSQLAPPAQPVPGASAPKAMALSRGPKAIDHLIDGQLHVDATADKATRAGAKALDAGVLSVVQRLIAESNDFDQLRVRILEAFPSFDVERLNLITRGAVSIAAGAGVFSASKEAQE